MGTFSVGVRNAMLDAVARNVSYANPAVYVQLHLADPGAAGTTSPAANTSRQVAPFATAAAGGAISNTTAITWTAVSNTEVYSHVSLWSAATAGNFLGSDDLSATAAVTVGDTFTIAVGDLDLAFS